MIEPNTIGVLSGIATRPLKGRPMTEILTSTIVEGVGFESEGRPTGNREVTFLSVQSWRDTCAELGVELSWLLRRANLLVDGVDLSQCVGRTISIGSASITIRAETKPCGLMDQQHEGLRSALKPAFRGGVHGKVIVGGEVRVGDTVRVSS